MTQPRAVPGEVIREQTIDPGGHWSGHLQRGQVLRIVDLEGRQCVDLLCYNADDPSERYHAPNTIKKAGTLALTRGHVLISDLARPLMTIAEDTCGGHDTIGGCCSAPSNELLYGVHDIPGCRENFLAALRNHGLDRRDLVPNLNLFCNLPVGPGNSLLPSVFAEGRSRPGDFVDLRAEMEVLVAISNCPQVNNPASGGHPTPVHLVIYVPR